MENTFGEALVSIVDDDAGIRTALAALFRSAGLAVEAFGAAEDFLASGKLDRTRCLVLDVHLPKMSGLELQRRLIEDGCQVPIVFITARDCARAQSLALEAGAAAFLSKPLSRGMLLSSVQAAIGSLENLVE